MSVTPASFNEDVRRMRVGRKIAGRDHREILASDLEAATVGCNMRLRTKEDLTRLIDLHSQINLFMSAVIERAAREELARREREGRS